MRATPLAGVDGCRGGWLLVTEDLNGELRARVHPNAAQLLEGLPESALIGIDIPIGLPPAGLRTCDQQARQQLGRPRMSSVFSAPLRPCLDARDFVEAGAIRHAIEGRKISLQTFNIMRKIREIDLLLRADQRLSERLVEVHPEVSFSVWNGARPMTHRKTTREGREERRGLIESAWPGKLEQLRENLPANSYGSDDLHDAIAVLWSIRRFAAGNAITFGPVGERDALGLPMRIVA